VTVDIVEQFQHSSFTNVYIWHIRIWTYSDTETKAEILNDQFHSVYTREDVTSMPEKGQSPYPDMPDIHIGEATHLV
jgi:hypothetical protein